MKKLLVIISLLAFASCTDAERAKRASFGASFKIELVNCNGTVTKSWISSGKVLSEAASDGYYFNDQKTGNLIEVTGTLIITEL